MGSGETGPDPVKRVAGSWEGINCPELGVVIQVREDGG